jgi:hypothetical protein
MVAVANPELGLGVGFNTESVEYVSTILDMCSRDPHTEV